MHLYKTLFNTGMTKNKINNYLKNKNITTFQTNIPIIQSIIWTHNWAVWKTYCEKNKNPELDFEKKLKKKLCEEEFYFITRNSLKNLTTKEIEIINNNTLFYKIQKYKNFKNIFYKQHLLFSI